METLENKIREQIKQAEKKFANSPQIIEFEKTAIEFDALVSEGIIKRRGNHLLSTSDRHLKDQVTFNVK